MSEDCEKPKKCMTCGKDLSSVVCEGKIGDMSVAFCDVHAKFCENCETIVCKVVKKD